MTGLQYQRLGVNIDHVATIRNARGGVHPDPLRAAMLAIEAGADGITAHLREDRRHITDDDIAKLKQNICKPLNFEMAATDEMLKIALEHVPNACCVVPEKREELTTEGGLDILDNHQRIFEVVSQLKEKDILVSLFVDPDNAQISAASDVGADIIELHTGNYCEAVIANNESEMSLELDRLHQAAKTGSSLGLEVHAGHGITYDSVKPIAAIPDIVELNIGHFLIGEAIFTGLHDSIKRMRQLMDQAR